VEAFLLLQTEFTKGNIEVDFDEMAKRLSLYADKGRVAGPQEMKSESMVNVRPDASRIRPLNSVDSYQGRFLAVDCSTRTLKRANNWGIYLMRPCFACVEGRNVKWGFKERICTVVGDAYTRGDYLEDVRVELESQMALELIHKELGRHDHGNEHSRGDYTLLDGGGYFGGGKKFRVSLYDECRDSGINLLALSKRSSILHDEKGRDFMATTGMLTAHPTWVYSHIKKANKEENLYGDISVVKLCGESPRLFRCDVMEYLNDRDVVELLSPLTFVSEDPRCLGYPIPLFLAHNFSAPSEAMLLHYHDQIEKTLNEAGLLELLKREELACNFPDELHGAKHAFDLEWVERV
jgi:hypothetical protein